MNTIFMNSKTSGTSDPHRLLLSLSGKQRLNTCCFIKSQHLLYIDKYKNFIQKYIFKISAPTWNEEFGFPDGSYSISNIQEYFEYIFKNMEKRLMIIISFHTFKIKTRYYIELLTPETMKLLESTKIEITKDENGKNFPHLEMS